MSRSQQLRTILSALNEPVAAGVLGVGLEPSCVAVFRDELVNMLPETESAHRLRQQTFTLAELLVRHDAMPEPRLSGKVLVHGHCHQKALFGMDAERELLARSGLAFEMLDSGCCGMAGSFGFERDHYAVSMAVGERRLLPAVRGAPAETLIIADGFSCREQIAQATPRRALHMAELLQYALGGRDTALTGPASEARRVDHSAAVLTRREKTSALVLLAITGLVVAAGVLRRQKRT